MAVDIINIATNGNIEDLRSVTNELLQAIAEDPNFMNQRNEMGKSALDIAAMLGKAQFLQELITNGANVQQITQNGYSALHHAASWGKLDCVKVLVDAGVDLQQKTFFGERPRECAARYNQEDCVDYLDRSEARFSLKSLVQLFKDTIADPEKHMGKLSKDDRVSGNKACDEKNNWVENNKDTATLEEIKTVISELEATLQPIFSKLKDQHQ